MDPNCQNLDDVAQECWLVLLANNCLTRPFIYTVARISVLRMIERRERKRERSYDAPDPDSKSWIDDAAWTTDRPESDCVGDADELIATIANKRLRKTAQAIVSTRTFADARRELGITKTTMQTHRQKLRELLPVPQGSNQ
jgi:DNA-directed RNA polymerase specialized sigma24 family protein